MSKPVLDSPEAAERAFYAAFEALDLDAMRRIWSADPDCVCVHPGGGRLRGYAEVMASWEKILGSGQRLRFKRRELAPFVGTDIAVHVLLEDIEEAGGSPVRGRVIATNAYRLEAGEWRMVLHHASPAPREASSTPSRAH
jgi:ketosteroid isomerase-like protein